MRVTEVEREEVNYSDLNLRSFDTQYLSIFSETTIDPLNKNNLLCISNKYGYFVTGLNSQFYISTTEKLRKSCRYPSSAESKFTLFTKTFSLDSEENIILITLSNCETFVLVVTTNYRVYHYKAAALLQQESATYSTIWELPLQQDTGDIILLEAHPTKKEFHVLLLSSGLLLLLQDGIPAWKRENVSSVCWSSDGKNMGLGLNNGEIIIVNLNNTIKKTFSTPEFLDYSDSWSIPFIFWPEARTLITVYWSTSPDTPDIIVYALNFSSEDTIFNKLIDLFPFEENPLSQVRFYSSLLTGFKPELSHLIVLCSNVLIESCIFLKGPGLEWCSGSVDELNRISLPCRKGEDGYPIGLALDVTASGTTYNLLPDLEAMPSVPVIYLVNSFGEIQAYECISRKMAIDNVESALMFQSKANFTPYLESSDSTEPLDNTLEDETPKSEKDEGKDLRSEKEPEKFELNSILTEGENSEQELPSPDLITLLHQHLIHPLISAENWDESSLTNFNELITQPPSWENSESLQREWELVDNVEAPDFVPNDIPVVSTTETLSSFEMVREFDSNILKTAILIGHFQSKWKSSLLVSGEISKVQTEISSLSSLIDESYNKLTSFHDQGLSLLDKLKYSDRHIKKVDEVLTNQFNTSATQQNLDFFKECDPGFQALMTCALVNIESHQHTYQNLLTILHRRFLQAPGSRELVLENSGANYYLSQLQSLHQRLQNQLNKINFLKSYNPQLDSVYFRDTSTISDAFSAMAGIAISPEAVAHSASDAFNSLWLDNFHYKYTNLSS